MSFTISEQSEVAQARRAAVALGETQALNDDDRGRLALVVTEIATNLIKHGQGGEMVMHPYDDPSGKGVEIVAMDKGIGIANIARAMEDGYSTSGTGGGGMGVIQRQADAFEMFSRPGLGTVIMIRVGAKAVVNGGAQVGAILDPYPGETLCGDAWAFATPPAGLTLIVADGSGHGPLAFDAANAAMKIFREAAAEPCEEIMRAIHNALRPTRGAAVGIARIDAVTRQVKFVGIGNIGSAMADATGLKRMVSNNGTAGHLAPRVREFVYPYVGTPTVILHSDGLTTKWDLSSYPGLAIAHPTLLAGVLFRDFRRGRDDASIAVVRGV